MESRQIENSQIRLQENIPLTEEEIKEMEIGQKATMRIVTITIIVGILFLGIIAVLSVEKETLDNLKYYDYIAFSCIALLFFSFCYFIAMLADRYNKYNWKKDKLNGKNKLTSVVINRDKTEHAEYLTFAGPFKNEKIRIEVKQEDYNRYKAGSKVVVTYLKFSKKALKIIDSY
ncbi:hypothetical protein [Pedobacter panaciterrae]|jgi:hypothetical protein|uniref:DUF3592 domain-containing protein n=1 Tax=Pedobacter panaciterrae TaxID=363849 RepID=A0ABU8NI45_9SPHI|nr:hypothetical protein [Pedobacter panaciterrae]NQX56956.1 hypothetical protein [Pedobacter panaciterrae]